MSFLIRIMSSDRIILLPTVLQQVSGFYVTKVKIPGYIIDTHINIHIVNKIIINFRNGNHELIVAY